MLNVFQCYIKKIFYYNYKSNLGGIMFDKDRLNHSFAVANKMVEIGKKCCLNKEKGKRERK